MIGSGNIESTILLLLVFDIMPHREQTRLDLQRLLDDQKSQKQRNIMGQFSTPSRLALDVLRFAKTIVSTDSNIRFLDPAFGTGSFYSALLAEFPIEQISSAEGIEIDPHYGIPAADLWASSSLRFRVADFTALDPPPELEKPNLIICNPPYVRHHHLDLRSKSRLSEKAAQNSGIAIGGLAGLYCYFMAIAHAWLAEGGLAGWLIPSEFMDVNYGSAIRRYLTERVQLVHIHRFDPTELQFGDAQVSSTVVWFRKQCPRPNQLTTMSYGGTLSHPNIQRESTIGELQRSRKWSSLAKAPSKGLVGGYKLSDLFKVKRGLATGDNSFFVLTEEKAERLGIPPQFLKPLLPSPRYIDGDIIHSDADGLPLSSRRLYLLDCDLSEGEVLRLSPCLAKYLESGREKALETYICSRRTPWYSQEARPPAPIVCTYMGRGLEKRERPFRFILNNSSATALNVYLMLYPTPMLSLAMGKDTQLISKIWEVLKDVPAEVLLGEGRVYGGGLYKMEPKELANLPADDIMALLPERNMDGVFQEEMFSNLVA